MYLRSDDPQPFCQVRCGVTVDKRRAALASAIESLSLAGAAEPQDPRPPELRALALAMAGDLCAAESALAGARRLRTSGSGSFADGLAALLHAAAGRSQSALRVAELLRARAPAEATWLLLLCGKLELEVGGGGCARTRRLFRRRVCQLRRSTAGSACRGGGGPGPDPFSGPRECTDCSASRNRRVTSAHRASRRLQACCPRAPSRWRWPPRRTNSKLGLPSPTLTSADRCLVSSSSSIHPAAPSWRRATDTQNVQSMPPQRHPWRSACNLSTPTCSFISA